MRSPRALGLAAGVFLGAWSSVVSAGPLNPDVSVIGDIRSRWNEERESAYVFVEEVEVGITGPLNPYASAQVFIAFHGLATVEIEEAKLLLDRYFPAGFGLLAGLSYLDFGQLNQLHPHAYPFLNRPLMDVEFFGPDGARDVTARVDWLAPIDPFTLRATVGAVRGAAFLGPEGHGHDHEDGEEEIEETDPEVGGSARLEIFAEPTRSFSFLLGSSVLFGRHDPLEGAKGTWADVDLKMTWDLGPRRLLIVNAEGILGSLEATDEVPESEPWGFFTSADLRLSRAWNVGGVAEGSTERHDDEHVTYRYGGFVGLSLLEETTMFRALLRRTEPDEGVAETEFFLQALFGLGPHMPHRY